MSVLTVREVPNDVKDTLARAAKERGQSLQALVLGILTREARFSRNREMLAEVTDDLADGSGAGEDAPDAAEIVADARDRRRVDAS